MIRKLLLILLFAALGASAWMVLIKSSPSEDVFALEEGYRLLYNGETLDGWRSVGGESTYRASGDSIIGRHGPGANTFLRTEQSFGDFSLKMQMRWDEKGNSGVMFRAGQRGGDGRSYGYQYELDPSGRAWSAGIYDESRRGWLADLENNPEARAAVKLDDWNDIEIEARGSRLKTWINGVAAADIIDGLDAEGFIALQVHSGDVGVMRWRRIRIKELPSASQKGPTLVGTEQWRVRDIGELVFEGDSLSADFTRDDGWIVARRQFDDARISMTVPACDKPTVIRMRYLEDSQQDASFAEVRIYADRAEARLVSSAGEQVMEAVTLDNASEHVFTGVSVGDAIVLTVDETDALRVNESGLVSRGQLWIQPARCDSSFRITDIAWFLLRERRDEVSFYQTLDTQPAPVHSPEEAQAAFSIAPGFEIELVAAEPLVEDPVAIAWDEYGRLYVVEMRGYMPDAYGTGSEEPVGQVVRLQDNDGDGRMDSSEVFLGALVNPRAIAVVNEGILVGEPPNLWLCELPQKDSLCKNRKSVGDYASDAGGVNVEHMENALRQGLDNWLYNSKSTRQLRLVDGELQTREGLFRGQWGISKDDYGRWFYNHNSTWIQADLFAAEDLVTPGGNSSHQGLGVDLTDPAEVFSVRVNPGVNRAYLEGTLREDGRLNRATGVSGLVVYRGDQFPERYRGQVFVPESAGNVVAQFALTEDGIAVTASQQLYSDDKWGQRDFLGSTDERFRPVDGMNGPDGALYIIDMYRGIIQDDHFLTDELREQIFQRKLDSPIGMGRIWRIRHSRGRSGYATPALTDATDKALVAALSHQNGWVRDTAQRLLLKRPGKVYEMLRQVATAGDTIPALHAIWALQGRGELDRELVVSLARSADLQRQLQVLRAGRSELGEEDLLALYQAVDPAPEALAMQLAFAMGDWSKTASVRDALGMLLEANLASNYVSQAVIRAVRGNELVFLQELLAAQRLKVPGKGAESVLAALAAGAYRTLRGDLSSSDPANPALEELLGLVESRSGSNAWQQLAMLAGFEAIASSGVFVPAQMAAAPSIFSDGTVSEKDPLWKARLASRVAFTWPGDELAMGITPLSPEQLQLMALGEAFYPKCAACHGDNGEGGSGLAPPLVAVSWVTGPPEWLGRIILQGMSGPVEVDGKVWDAVMPAHGHLQELDDATLAGLMTYLRRSWGNKQDPVNEDMVAQIRASSAGRGEPWTVAELEAVPFDRGFKKFLGKYSVSFITITISEKPEGLYFSVPMYGAGLLNPLSDTVFTAETAEGKVKIEFLVEKDGAVPTMVIYRDGEKVSVRRKKG
jgi:mono/diheme cytochrome c family protein/glucose/arabinose dehydrogenase